MNDWASANRSNCDGVHKCLAGVLLGVIEPLRGHGDVIDGVVVGSIAVDGRDVCGLRVLAGVELKSEIVGLTEL